MEVKADTVSTIFKSFSKFFLGTSFSRITGLLRDIFLAFFFGGSIHIAAFFVAYRLSNLFRRVFAESSLNMAFIPHFEQLKIEDKKKSIFFVRDMFFTLLLLLGAVTFLSEIALGVFFKKSTITSLTMIMFPGLIFICLYAFLSAIMQCHGSYFLPAFSPVFFNLTWISSILLFHSVSDQKFVYLLSFVVPIAFFIQFIVLLPSTLKILKDQISFKEFLNFKLFSFEVKKMLKPIIYSIIGISAIQVNSALDSIFAYFADEKGPAYLWYAMRLYQLPIALFSVSIFSAILPPLTRAFKNNDLIGFKKILNVSFKNSFTFMIIATFGVIVLAGSIVNLIFVKKSFDIVCFENTTMSFIAYSLGLVSVVFVMIVSASFYAVKNYFYPAISSVVSVIVNIILNSIFIYVFKMGFVSVAYATTISSIINFFTLNYFLKQKIEKSFNKMAILSFIKVSTITAMSASFTILFGFFLKDPSILFILKKAYVLKTDFLHKIYSFLSLFSIYILSVLFLSYVFKIDEVLSILKIRSKKTEIEKDKI